jgi:hypothetical protein
LETQTTEESPVLKERPKTITIIAWILIIMSVLQIAITGIGFGAPTILGSIWTLCLKGCALASGIGFLKMKRWAIYLYFGAFVTGTVALYLVPLNEEAFALYTTPTAVIALILIPIIVAALTLPQWKKMS